MVISISICLDFIDVINHFTPVQNVLTGQYEPMRTLDLGL